MLGTVLDPKNTKFKKTSVVDILPTLEKEESKQSTKKENEEHWDGNNYSIPLKHKDSIPKSEWKSQAGLPKEGSV